MATYLELLSESEKEATVRLAPERAAETHQKFLHRVSEVNIKIAEAKNNLSASLGRYPLDINTVVSSKNSIALLEREKKVMEDTIAELFPATK